MIGSESWYLTWGADAAFIIDSMTFAIATLLLIPVTNTANSRGGDENTIFQNCILKLSNAVGYRVYTESAIVDG